VYDHHDYFDEKSEALYNLSLLAESMLKAA